MKHLTQVGYFSPSVDFGASVDHYKDLFKELSKSGIGIKIGRFCVKIQLLFHHKTNIIATS